MNWTEIGWKEGDLEYRVTTGGALLRQRHGGTGWETAHPVMGHEAMRRAVACLEVYRKALEPFAVRLGGWIEDARLNGVTHPWFEGSLGPEEVAALHEACRLMGLLDEDREGVKPE